MTARKLTTSQQAKLARIIEHHDRHKGAYFWTPPSNASGRRAAEQRGSFAIQFVHCGTTYRYESDVSCSCKTYYYTGTFWVNGARVNVRPFRKLHATCDSRRAA